MSSREVADAIGEAEPRTKTAPAVEQLERKRRELAAAEAELSRAETAMDVDATIGARQRIAVIKDFIATLDTNAAAEREEQATLAAEKRSLAIKRALGSVVASIEGDEENLAAATRAYVAAVRRVNDRYHQIESLAAEDAALRDRFGIEGAKIPHVVPPNERPRCVEAARTVQSAGYATYHIAPPDREKCEHGLRERRTYVEIAGTPASRIIEAAGLKPWRDLTPQEQRAVAAVVSERERSREFSAELATEAAIERATTAIGAPRGSVHRG